jgi:hypothetical protein
MTQNARGTRHVFTENAARSKLKKVLHFPGEIIQFHQLIHTNSHLGQKTTPMWREYFHHRLVDRAIQLTNLLKVRAPVAAVFS